MKNKPSAGSDGVNARLSKFIEYLNTSQNEFAKSIGVSSPLISQMLNKNSNFGIDTLQKIISRYPSLNISWLLRGTEPMILDDEDLSQVVHRPVKVPVIRNQNYFDYVNDLIDLDAKNVVSMMLPSHEFFFPRTASFQVSQQNMNPTLHVNDYVIAELCNDWKQSLHEGLLYVVVTRNGVFFKRFRSFRHSELVFENDNILYPEDVFYESEIKEIWAVKSRLSFHLQKQKATQQTIENLSDLLKSLKEDQGYVSELPAATDHVTSHNNYISTLFSNLRKQKVSIFYYGSLSPKILLGLKERIKEQLGTTFKKDIKNRKRIYSLCIEIFSVLNISGATPSPSFFSLVCSDQAFFISVGSVMPADSARALDKELKLNKSKSNTEIMKRVKAFISTESLKDRDHAILGLLGIASRAENSFESYVEKVNDEESLFILKIESKLAGASS